MPQSEAEENFTKIVEILHRHRECNTVIDEKDSFSPEQDRFEYISRPKRGYFSRIDYYRCDTTATKLVWIMHPDHTAEQDSWYIIPSIELVKSTREWVKEPNDVFPRKQTVMRVIDDEELRTLSPRMLRLVRLYLEYTLDHVYTH